MTMKMKVKQTYLLAAIGDKQCNDQDKIVESSGIMPKFRSHNQTYRGDIIVQKPKLKFQIKMM